MLISHATAVGSRPEQQDRWVIAEVNGTRLLAVMDGHGGTQTAQVLADQIAKVYQATSQKELSAETTLRNTVVKLAQLTEQESSGSTLSVVLIPETHQMAHIAVVGDSPVLIIDANGNLQASTLHNARSNTAERTAALKRGARYSGGYLEDPQHPGRGLQLSRTLGDHAFARILNREPEIYSVPLGKASFVLLATDGILDSFEVDLMGQFERVAKLARERDAQGLVDDALKRETGDNVTVILWKTY